MRDVAGARVMRVAWMRRELVAANPATSAEKHRDKPKKREFLFHLRVAIVQTTAPAAAPIPAAVAPLGLAAYPPPPAHAATRSARPVRFIQLPPFTSSAKPLFS